MFQAITAAANGRISRLEVVRQTGSGPFAADPGAATVTPFLRQADAAYAFLSRQPQADPARMLVVGHSEGGMFALLIAGSVTGKPAGLALLEPQDERILSLITIQADEAISALVAQGKRHAGTGDRRHARPQHPPCHHRPLMQALTAADITGPGLRLLQGTDHYMHLPSQPDTQPVLAPAAITAIEQWAQPFASAP